MQFNWWRDFDSPLEAYIATGIFVLGSLFLTTFLLHFVRHVKCTKQLPISSDNMVYVGTIFTYLLLSWVYLLYNFTLHCLNMFTSIDTGCFLQNTGLPVLGMIKTCQYGFFISRLHMLLLGTNYSFSVRWIKCTSAIMIICTNIGPVVGLFFIYKYKCHFLGYIIGIGFGVLNDFFWSLSITIIVYKKFKQIIRATAKTSIFSTGRVVSVPTEHTVSTLRTFHNAPSPNLSSTTTTNVPGSRSSRSSPGTIPEQAEGRQCRQCRECRECPETTEITYMPQKSELSVVSEHPAHGGSESEISNLDHEVTLDANIIDKFGSMTSVSSVSPMSPVSPHARSPHESTDADSAVSGYNVHAPSARSSRSMQGSFRIQSQIGARAGDSAECDYMEIYNKLFDENDREIVDLNMKLFVLSLSAMVTTWLAYASAVWVDPGMGLVVDSVVNSAFLLLSFAFNKVIYQRLCFVYLKFCKRTWIKNFLRHVHE